MTIRELAVRAVKELLQQANMKNLNSKYVYMNVLRELRTSTAEITEIEDLKSIKFVGERVYKAIAKGVEKLAGTHSQSAADAGEREAKSPRPSPPAAPQTAQAPLEIEMLEDLLSDRLSSSCIIVSSSDDEEHSAGEDALARVTECSSTPKKSRKKNYLPAYRSAPYAILRALHELKAAHKYLVAIRAAPYTNAEFSSSAKFSAFGAFKTLEAKGLVYAESKSKYFLTAEGTALCERLFTGEAPPPEHRGIELIIDAREKKTMRDRGFFQNYFSKNGIPASTRVLGLGDFLWIRDETALNYIVERKGGSDFASSISDGRYREQKNRLRLFNLRTFYLVENLRCNETNANLCQYCLMEVKMEKFVVLETEDINESAEAIGMLDKRIRAGDFEESVSYGSFIEEGSKQIDAYTVFLVALTSIRGLGKAKALRIAGEYGTLNGFCERAEQPRFEIELAGVSADGKMVGRRMAQNIIGLLT
ncbi:crossover junction endonuclease MUS81 [Pancytospora philotis]|nr:crossover junction endonuclease MUS81 [Pancytospora philotis]